MNSTDLLNEIYGIDKAIIESSEKHANNPWLYEFKAKQIWKLRNSYQRAFEEIQHLNYIKMKAYPLSLSFSATENEEFPSFDTVQNKLSSLFKSMKGIGTNTRNLYLADFSFGSTVLCLDLKKDSSKDIDSIDDFMKIVDASAHENYTQETRQQLKVEELDERLFFERARQFSPSGRSHIEKIKIVSAITPKMDRVQLLPETRRVLTEYVSERTVELPEIVTGYIMEVDDHHKSFQLYKGITEESEFIVKVYHRQDMSDMLNSLAEKKRVRIKIKREGSRYFFEEFL